MRTGKRLLLLLLAALTGCAISSKKDLLPNRMTVGVIVNPDSKEISGFTATAGWDLHWAD